MKNKTQKQLANGGQKSTLLLGIWSSVVLLVGVWGMELAAQKTRALDLQSVRFNSMGFYSKGPKVVVVAGDAGEFSILHSTTRRVLHRGKFLPAQHWDLSAESVRLGDFSKWQKPGNYLLKISGLAEPIPFTIAARPHEELAVGLLRSYYFQRASTNLSEELAGVWHRPAGHPDDSVIVHESAVSPGRPAGTIISSPKGWYDAGDYNKYIVNSGISTWTLMSLAVAQPEWVKSTNLRIPESGGVLPDLLAEVRWNLDWMLTMQDPGDGGVYHKLTNLNFDGMKVMPHEARTPRFVVQKSTTAAFDFAAVMAKASRVYRPWQPAFADSCLAAARRAYAWGMQNPNVPYVQPPDVKTGQYGDSNLEDERLWAAAELFVSTGDSAFLREARSGKVYKTVPYWQMVGPLGLITLARHGDTLARQAVLEVADTLLSVMSTNPYRISMRKGDFVWGSNAVASNQGMMLAVAHELTGNEAYLKGVVNQVDYLLGRNPFARSFVTGFGRNPPRFPHHRQSEADDVDAPVPGLVAGGSNPSRQDSSYCPKYTRLEVALSWIDETCSYASNEVAINWNAPAGYITAYLDAEWATPRVRQTPPRQRR